jgi:hypothetical protein
MPDTLEKLRPDRDLQCFYFHPSAIAALSGTSPTGFTVSGSWRQQFDWAVIEWNRDNVYDHPGFRNLPDGDLSGLTLTYEETRTNCIPLDSDLFPTVDWPFVRVWAGDNGSEVIYFVKLNDPAIATPIEGSYSSAYADFTLSGTVTAGDYVGLAYLSEHFTYQLLGGDTAASAASNIVAAINTSPILRATQTGATIRVYYTNGTDPSTSTAGANGNRIGIYSYTSGAGTLVWDSPAKTLQHGTSPTKWRISLNFGDLIDRDGRTIPATKIRKVRWTYAADLQPAAYNRGDFAVVVSNWTVTGSGRGYSVAGPGSRRFEDDSQGFLYSGTWDISRGNYSGGSIHHTSAAGASVQYAYTSPQAHTLYAGMRYTGNAATVAMAVDGTSAGSVNLQIPGEDVLVRWPVGQFAAGTHTVLLTHAGPDGTDFYFDFLEAAVPNATVPVFAGDAQATLATDWDTDHSLALAPERTAWFIDTLAFKGRANHYVGALWFYELTRVGQNYATATITFSGTPDPNYFAIVRLGRVGQPSTSDAVLTKLIHVGDTATTLATAFAQELNRGYTAVWASSSGPVVTIQSRSMGLDGDQLTLAVSTTSANLTIAASGSTFTGGVDGDWRTDLTASPRINRAVRDWTLSYLTALHGYGIDAACAFSMELQHGDPSAAAGIAQMGPAGDPVLLPTPSLQTNFSPTSSAFWQEVYLEMAAIQQAAGLVPFLQFGEVQWWYFTNDGLPTPVHDYHGMPFYDPWTTARFLTLYGYPLPVFFTNDSDPAAFPTEVAFLVGLVGAFTDGIMAFVRATYSNCRFEVLYPTDVNQTEFNKAINYPVASWTPAALAVLKTESFGFTLGRDLDKAQGTLDFGQSLGFQAAQRSHLVGCGDPTSSWIKEAQMAEGMRFESVVLFALDQFCLIGYEDPLPETLRRSLQMAS